MRVEATENRGTHPPSDRRVISLLLYCFVPVAVPVTLSERLHGVVKLPDAVQVRVKSPGSNIVTELPPGTTAPLLSVHWYSTG